MEIMSILDISPIVGTDSYKGTHKPQYELGTDGISSYFSTRLLAKWEQTLWFGNLQYFLRKYLRPISQEDIDEAEDVYGLHFGTKDHFNRYKPDWQYILNRYGGFLPLRIRAVPEGTIVPKNNVLFNIENEDERLAWLTNQVETRLSHPWYPFAIATQSMHAFALIRKWHERTGGNPDAATFGLHDFGYRGATCEEQAAIGGLRRAGRYRWARAPRLWLPRHGQSRRRDACAQVLRLQDGRILDSRVRAFHDYVMGSGARSSCAEQYARHLSDRTVRER
jgi:nicotinamide phosphoribosyltransferase